MVAVIPAMEKSLKTSPGCWSIQLLNEAKRDLRINYLISTYKEKLQDELRGKMTFPRDTIFVSVLISS